MYVKYAHSLQVLAPFWGKAGLFLTLIRFALPTRAKSEQRIFAVDRMQGFSDSLMLTPLR